MKIIGVLLIVLGIIGIAYGGISWTRPKTVVDAGPIQIKTDRRETLPISPIAGVICVVAGVLLVSTRRR